jgi:hypothetical protein
MEAWMEKQHKKHWQVLSVVLTPESIAPQEVAIGRIVV